MATSVSGYSYDVKKSYNDELNFPGVVFTLGTPYVKVDETAKSCEITTEEQLDNRIKKIEQVIGKETVVPVNTVFKYITNSYDFGINDISNMQLYPEDKNVLPASNISTNFGFTIYNRFFRRFLGDVDPRNAPGASNAIVTNYYSLRPHSEQSDEIEQFIKYNTIDPRDVSGTYEQLFNGVVYSNTRNIEIYGDIMDSSWSTVQNANKCNIPTFYTDANNGDASDGGFITYLGVKRILVKTNKRINFKIRISPVKTWKYHNTILLDSTNTNVCTILEIEDDSVEYKYLYEFNIPEPENAALVTSQALYTNIRGNSNDNVTFRDFYNKNNTQYYKNLERGTLDVNNFIDTKTNVQYTFGAIQTSSEYSLCSFFNNISGLDPANLNDENKLKVYESDDGDYINTIIPLGNEIHSVTTPGLHLFANVFTNYRKHDTSLINDFAQIEIVLNSVQSYEESVSSQVSIKLGNVTLGVFNDLKKNNDTVYGDSSVDGSANIFIAGVSNTSGQTSNKLYPTSMREIFDIYRYFCTTFGLGHGESIDPVNKHQIFGAGYCMATVASTLSQYKKTTIGGDLPYNAKMFSNTDVVDTDVSIIAARTAPATIRIDRSSLKVDGYSVNDLNGYVKNLLSSDKHVISFDISAPDGTSSQGLPYGEIVFSVKTYDINNFDNLNFDACNYVNLPTVKYKTADNQYVSYLLKINACYLLDYLTPVAGPRPSMDSSIYVAGAMRPINDEYTYYKLSPGKTASITIIIPQITSADIGSDLARVFDVCIAVDDCANSNFPWGDYDVFNSGTSSKIFLSRLSNDDIIDNTDVVGYSEAGGIGTMFIQEGIKKSEDVPFLFDDAEAGQDKDIINVGDELPSEPLDQAMKLALNYRDLSIKVMPYTLVNYINTYSGAGTIESTGEMKDEYKPYLYDWHVNDGLCLDKDTFVIDLYETSSKCEDTRYWGTYKSTMSFIKSTLYERLDKMNPFEPIVP